MTTNTTTTVRKIRRHPDHLYDVPELAEVAELADRLRAEAHAANRAVQKAEAEVRDAEKADIGAMADAIGAGKATPKPGLPAARAKLDEARRKAEAHRLAAGRADAALLEALVGPGGLALMDRLNADAAQARTALADALDQAGQAIAVILQARATHDWITKLAKRGHLVSPPAPSASVNVHGAPVDLGQLMGLVEQWARPTPDAGPDGPGHGPPPEAA